MPPNQPDRTIRAGRCLPWLLLVLTACTTAPPSNYVQVNEVPAKSKIEHEMYQFDIVPASTYPHETPWRIYRQPKEPTNTILQTGLPGHAHTLSVLLKHRNLDPARLKPFAESLHPGTKFQPVRENPNCVRSDPSRPMQLGAETRGYIAICLNPETHDVFELTLTEKSLIAKPDSPDLIKAMFTFFETFRFK